MGKSIPNVRFELNAVYKTYSEQLLLAGNISNFLLDSSNIDSAGGQVEGSLRILLKKLLPDRVSVSHGHVVDKNAFLSNQQDVLIAESFYTKSLIKTLDGTEFYPIEAIFATGEVKKTWSQQKLEAAMKSIERTKNTLKRTQIKSNLLPTGSQFITLSDDIISNPIRNPLFCFTFSLDFDRTYNENKVAQIYKNQKNTEILPNISIVLKRGIYVMVNEDELKNGEVVIKLYPQFIEKNVNYRWVLLKLEPEENLAYLIFMLTQHINDTILEKVSAMDYAHSMIKISATNITPL